MVSLLTAGAYYIGKHQQVRNSVIVPPFYTTPKDSLEVCRYNLANKYISTDGKLKVSVFYLQIGDNDRVYQLRLSNESEPCYGNIDYDMMDPAEIGIFVCPNHPEPIVLYDNGDDESYIQIDNTKYDIKKQH